MILSFFIVPNDGGPLILLFYHCFNKLRDIHFMINDNNFLIVGKKVSYAILFKKFSYLTFHSFCHPPQFLNSHLFIIFILFFYFISKTVCNVVTTTIWLISSWICIHVLISISNYIILNIHFNCFFINY